MSNPWFDTLGVFDLETTGIDVETSRIVSAHVGVLDPTGNLVEEWNWLADPGIPIPEQASAVHGISTERARAEGRPAAAVVAEIIVVLQGLFDRGLAVTIYNAPYDSACCSTRRCATGLRVGDAGPDHRPARAGSGGRQIPKGQANPRGCGRRVWSRSHGCARCECRRRCGGASRAGNGKVAP